MAKKSQPQKDSEAPAEESKEVARSKLMAALERRGIDEFQWRTLCDSLFPGARPESVIMAVDYCRARKLDVLKKPCHIVPMSVWNAREGRNEWRDVILPGIYEYRITARRTGEYLGHDKPVYGPEVDFEGVMVPEFCEFVVYRWNPMASQRAEFPVSVSFSEVVALKDGKPNHRWSKAPKQMLTKCAEAAALREAFPDEIGGVPTYEEVVDQPAIQEHSRSRKPVTVEPTASEGEEFNEVPVERIKALTAQAGITVEQMCAGLQIQSLDTLPLSRVPQVLEWLQGEVDASTKKLAA